MCIFVELGVLFQIRATLLGSLQAAESSWTRLKFMAVPGKAGKLVPIRLRWALVEDGRKLEVEAVDCKCCGLGGCTALRRSLAHNSAAVASS